MLLKLIPGRQEPTIHYTISFADLPASLPSPASWTVQMSHLFREDLEVPATLHSLDRAAGIPSLLEEVSLDLEMREVRCRFIDGSVEQFGFDHNGETLAGSFTDALEDIVTVVAESTREDEKAKREREQQRSRSMSVAVMPAAPVKPSGKAVGKHKKQRSLFMQLVSCVHSMVSSTPPPTSSLPHRATKLPTSHTRTMAPNTLATVEAEPSASAIYIPQTPGASARARALRRAARSALVDTFRRFVLSELTSRYYVGPDFRLTMGIANGKEFDCPYLYRYQRERNGFCVWILHSMKRRALERMEQILEEAGAPIPIGSLGQRHLGIDNMLQTTTMDVPLSFSDEEDDDDDRPSSNMEGTPANPAMGSYTEEAKGSSRVRPSMPSRRASTMTSHSSDSVSTHSSATSSSGESTASTSTAATSIESDTGSRNPIESSSEDGYPLRRESLLSIKEQDHPPLHHLSLASQQEYMQLYELRTRLNNLVQFTATQARVVVEESRSRAEILLVRSKRRAWLNKSLKHTTVANGSSPYGFAAPFRSSPLAMYVVSAADLARQGSAIARGSVSSTSSLSSAYFRSVSSMSSTSSSASSISKRSSARPRIRPKIDFEAALAAAVVGLDTDDPDIGGPIKFADVPHDDCEFEIFDKPSDARRHRRKRAELPVVPPQGMQVFPVTEEQPLRAVRRRNHRRSFEIDQGHRTFMGCDEIRVEDTMHSEIVDKQHFELGFGYPVQMFPSSLPPHAHDAQCGEPLSPTDVGAEHMTSETELGMHRPIGAGRPKIRPRMRTNSMIGALLRGAKGVRETFGNVPKQQLPKAGIRDVAQTPASALPESSILCQPLATHQPPPHTPPVSPSFGYISYSHNPPGISPAPLPKFAANRRAEDISRPPSPACVSTTAIYADEETGLDVEMSIQLRAPDANDDDGEPLSKNDDEFPSSTDTPPAVPRKRSSSYLSIYRPNHLRPKLDGVFPES